MILDKIQGGWLERSREIVTTSVEDAIRICSERRSREVRSLYGQGGDPDKRRALSVRVSASGDLLIGGKAICYEAFNQFCEIISAPHGFARRIGPVAAQVALNAALADKKTSERVLATPIEITSVDGVIVSVLQGKQISSVGFSVETLESVRGEIASGEWAGNDVLISISDQDVHIRMRGKTDEVDPAVAFGLWIRTSDFSPVRDVSRGADALLAYKMRPGLYLPYIPKKLRGEVSKLARSGEDLRGFIARIAVVAKGTERLVEDEIWGLRMTKISRRREGVVEWLRGRGVSRETAEAATQRLRGKRESYTAWDAIGALMQFAMETTNPGEALSVSIRTAGVMGSEAA